MVATAGRQAAGIWVALCFVVVMLMFIAPVQGARAPEGYWYQCPSLQTILQVRADSDSVDRRMPGIENSRAYIHCSAEPATRWALASLLLPTFLCLGGFAFVRRADARARSVE
jgi:hypothetical protein